MIPKVIHYVWYGRSPKPADVKRYIQTWKKVMPDYEIVEWNESNLDPSVNRFAAEAYSLGQWAFVSDWARLKILHDAGGIYMDTDVEALRPLDPFLTHGAFTGFENPTMIPTAVMGAVPGHPWIKELLSYYDNRSFVLEDGSWDTLTNVHIITEISRLKYGFVPNGERQILAHDVHIYPPEWFCTPRMVNGEPLIDERVYTIHHFKGSWLPPAKKARRQVVRAARKILGHDIVESLRAIKRTLVNRRS